MENASAAFSVTSEDSLVEEFNREFTNTVLPVTVFVGIETVVGFFGNLLVLYVFLFKYHVCNFRYFVLCLAFTDISGTLTTMPGEVLTQMKWYVYSWREVCKIKSFFNIFTVSAEAFCLLTIAIDRYRKVCAPFGWQIQPRIALVLCGVIYLLSTILALPVAFFWGIRTEQKTYRNQNITVTMCEKDQAYANTDLPADYTTGINVILGILLTAMFLLYIFVASKLTLQKKLVSGVTHAKSAISGVSSTATSGLSSDVGISKYKAEFSDTGYSSETESKSKAPKAHYISSDGGLTTDDEDSRPSRYAFTISSNRPTQVKKLKRSDHRLRRKTRIMFILTISFILTTVCYLTLLSFIAKSDDILQEMSDTGRAFYFFFFRLYFINHVINPFVYGFLDPHFRKAVKKIKYTICKCRK